MVGANESQRGQQRGQVYALLLFSSLSFIRCCAASLPQVLSIFYKTTDTLIHTLIERYYLYSLNKVRQWEEGTGKRGRCLLVNFLSILFQISFPLEIFSRLHLLRRSTSKRKTEHSVPDGLGRCSVLSPDRTHSKIKRRIGRCDATPLFIGKAGLAKADLNGRRVENDERMEYPTNKLTSKLRPLLYISGRDQGSGVGDVVGVAVGVPVGDGVGVGEGVGVGAA